MLNMFPCRTDSYSIVTPPAPTEVPSIPTDTSSGTKEAKDGKRRPLPPSAPSPPSSTSSSSGHHQTHVYITDATNFQEAETMLLHYHALAQQGYVQSDLLPAGSAAFWQPRHARRIVNTASKKSTAATSKRETTHPSELDEELVASLKVHLPSHLAEAPDHGIKGVFILPTIMNRIFVQGNGVRLLFRAVLCPISPK